MSAGVAFLRLAELGPASMLTAEFDDAIKGLVILVLLLGPGLKKLLERLGKAAAGSRARPSEGGPAPSTGRRPPVTWEELMRGAPPEAPTVPEVDVEPEPVSVSTSPKPAWGLPMSSIGLEPLSEIPEEDHLESLGIDEPLSSTLAPVGVPSLPRELKRSVSDAWGTDRTRPSRRGMTARLKAGGWRDAVLMAEVLGPPLALREDWSHPGPPLGQRSEQKHG